jgi:hypothetical protein
MFYLFKNDSLTDNLETMQEEEQTIQDDDEECRIFSGIGKLRQRINLLPLKF